MIKLFNANCIDVIFSNIKPESIDLVVTSPPYDDLREYNNSSTWNWYDFTSIANGLWKVIKKGGVVVWVVGDRTVKGSETGSSFKQALYFREIGFNLHDTMIYKKLIQPFYDSRWRRYKQEFEYMFIFSKGKPKPCNIIRDRVVKNPGRRVTKVMLKRRSHGGFRKECVNFIIGKYQARSNVWVYQAGVPSKHPAPFPEKLAKDHIITWSNEGDVVLDPMMGSGTTGKMAKMLNRDFIGIEIDKEYFGWAKERIDKAKNDYRLMQERKNHIQKILKITRKFV